MLVKLINTYTKGTILKCDNIERIGDGAGGCVFLLEKETGKQILIKVSDGEYMTIEDEEDE